MDVVGHFAEGQRVREALVVSRSLGVPFRQAWEAALHDAHLRRNGFPLSERRQEVAEALEFARPAFERAYAGAPRTRQDHLAQALLHAMEGMYEAEHGERIDRELLDLMEAA